MEELNLISEGLYGVVSYIIGPEPIIDIRRMVMDLKRGVESVIYMTDEINEEEIYSGSMAEGFRFASSDHDVMYVRRGIRAVFSPFLRLADTTGQIIFLAETNNTKPGFAILRLIHQTRVDRQVMASLVEYGSGHYLSSALWVGSGLSAQASRNFSVHGPCLSGILGTSEADFAECIKSDRLPTPAYNSLLQLYRSGTLSYQGLQNICLKGCHFVAIGPKRPIHEALEWRISFSFAEKTIIHSFNHAQLLCYGLLKIFLKEAIESSIELKGLLCSYFMKTAVFWMSLGRSVHWTPDHFLCCFLKCLHLLTEWVACEYCPNFFIPENNMIADKFTRSQHTNLLTYLSGLCHEGYRCLLRCPSISDELCLIIQRPHLTYTLLSSLANINKSDVECLFIREIWNYGPLVSSNTEFAAVIQYLDQFQYENRYQITCINIWKYMYLSELALRTGSPGVSNILKTNSQFYLECGATTATLQNCEVDAASSLLYCAIYLYRQSRYDGVLRITKETKRRLQHQYIMYPWNIEKEKYAAAGGEIRPIIEMMRTVLAFPVSLFEETCIPELLSELLAASHQGLIGILIPPLVCTSFFGYLCHYRLGRHDLTISVLQELSNLLLYDDGYHIRDSERAISWDMLGICQEMSGDYQGAYRSYSFALQQTWCDIKAAVEMRLINLLYRFTQNST